MEVGRSGGGGDAVTPLPVPMTDFELHFPPRQKSPVTARAVSVLRLIVAARIRKSQSSLSFCLTVLLR